MFSSASQINSMQQLSRMRFQKKYDLALAQQETYILPNIVKPYKAPTLKDTL